jgi:hypothetical protein
MRARFVFLAAAVALVVASPSPAHATHHLWKITQLFSNASGSIQFIQLGGVAEDNENNLSAATLTSGSNPIYNFMTNLSSTATTGKSVLLATSNFASLPGAVVPDYIIPANFIATGGGSLNYSGFDSWTYGALPTDGVNALHKSGTTITTSPNTLVNFAGQTGAVNLATAVPALPTAAIAAFTGVLLLIASGLLRRNRRVV